MKRYNGKDGIPEMEESEFGHWVTFESYSLALLDANKREERKWEERCASEDLIRAGYLEQLTRQQIIISIESAILFISFGVFFLNWL